MGITLDLPDELANDLTAEAAQLGMPLNEYLLRIIAGGRPPVPTPRTGADLIAYWQSEGLIGSRPDISDSQQHARDLRAQAERRSKD